jgi:hypothetical protein
MPLLVCSDIILRRAELIDIPAGFTFALPYGLVADR